MKAKEDLTHPYVTEQTPSIDWLYPDPFKGNGAARDAPCSAARHSTEGDSTMKNQSSNTFTIITGAAGALVVVGAALLMAMQPAAATAQFAKETGKACGDCHTDAKGGGALTPLGEKFKANGNKMPSK